MIYPDVLPAWFAVPACVAVWSAWLGPIIRDHRRARRGR